MSAVAALYRLDGRPADRADLDRLVERLAHRGPDGHGVWAEGPVALGHQMRATTPEASREKLPLVGERGDCVLTADLRLDNREELLDALDLRDQPAEDVGDARLALAAWERWGEACLERLFGDFALVVWDRRARTLFAARDPLGVRPLCYHASAGLVAVASEVNALLSLPEVPRRLDEVRVADYLVSLHDDPARTFYRDIRRLPPGHCLSVAGGAVRVRRYWSADEVPEVRLGSDAAYAEAFAERFANAVRRRLRNAGPVGAMLSGGLDSSSVVCVARSLRAPDDGPLPVFSATFPDVPACDERPFIDAVVAQGGLAPHTLRADRLDPLGELPRRWRDGDPLHRPDYFMHWALFDLAAAQGVRVLLSGFGGDTTVSHGVAGLPELARGGRWWALARETRAFARAFHTTPRRILLRYLRPLAPDPLWRLLRRRGGVPLVNPALAARTALAAREREARRRARHAARRSGTDHRFHVGAPVHAEILEGLDWAAAAAGIEVRYPFLDRRLVELCLGLPPDQKLSQGLGRAVMRRALGPLLPPAVRDRPGKANLVLMMPGALGACAPALLEEVVIQDAGGMAPYVDLPHVQDAYRRHKVGGTPAHEVALWRAATLGLWLRRTQLEP